MCAVLAPAAAADTLVAAPGSADQVRSYGGALAWSERSAGGRWRLMVERSGQVAPAPVTLSVRPFRADLGPGPAGGVAAAYARCRSPRSCDTYMLDLDSGRETRLTAPARSHCRRVYGLSLWRGSLAWLGVDCRGRRDGAWAGSLRGRPRFLGKVSDYRTRNVTDRNARLVAVSKAVKTFSLVDLFEASGRRRVIAADANSDEFEDTTVWSATLDGSRLYWLQANDNEREYRADLVRRATRVLIRRRRGCTVFECPSRTLRNRVSPLPGPTGDIRSVAVDRGSVTYVDGGDVFRAAPPAAPGPRGIAAGPDGAVWFTDEGAGDAGRITPDGAVTRYPLGQGARPIGITAGPDGALWVAQQDGRIARITTAGTFTHVRPSNGGVGPSRPYAITPGPDGALWMTDATSAAWRISTTAQSSRQQFTRMLLTPGGIATGPDGALWLSIYDEGSIARLPPGGKSRVFSPTALSGERVREITAGPDGALWFTAYGDGRKFGAGAVGRIATGGSVTLFALRSPRSSPQGITTGPDGALWFAEYQANSIARMTVTGELTEYLLPTPDSGPTAITTGPNGALWFTEREGHRIGEITTAGQIREFALTPGS
jgi:virginiamycin B lyase